MDVLPAAVNADLAERFDEVARLYEEQGANRFRVEAWRGAAETLRREPRPVSEIYEEDGIEGLESLPGVGRTIGRAIATALEYGRLPLLDRLRGESDPVDLLMTVPGIGETFARRLHRDLGIETLEELEVAAHDGRLETIAGIGGKRLEGIRDSLSRRLSRVRPGRRTVVRPSHQPPVAEILDVDREYRERAENGELERIAPRRFNPAGEAWLPVLHTQRGDRHYTALFSNTARAHELGRTRDWVVVYLDDGWHERQWTVITARRGTLAGRRIVAGREPECEALYRARDAGGEEELRARERDLAVLSREPL